MLARESFSKVRHSIEMRCLCLMKWRSKLLQNLQWFWSIQKPIWFFILSFFFADEQIDLEKQRLYPETCGIQIYSPGGGHISKQSSRRGSGNNNSDKASLSNYSQSQSRRGSNRSSGGESEKSRRASLARNGAIVTSGMYFRLESQWF